MSYLTQFVVGGGGGGGIDRIAPDSGDNPVFPAGGIVSIVGVGGNVVRTVGSANTLTIELDKGDEGQLLIGGGLTVDPIWANLTTVGDTIEITTGPNTLNIDISTNALTTAIHGWNGSILETINIDVDSDGATITLSLQRLGGGDLTIVFSDGFFNFDTTPADTITLTAGSDTSPQVNYVYILRSTKLLTVSTSDFPIAEHAPIATVICQSAASLQANKAYKVQAWTDHVESVVGQGHISHFNSWIRFRNANYFSGVSPTLTITPNGGAPDNVIFTSAAGVVLQLHKHSFPPFLGTPDIYTINDPVTPFNIVTDLNSLLTDSTGASMSGRFFSLVIWGVVSEDTLEAKLMVNLPAGTYGNASSLTADDDKFANFSIPVDFRGSGFLIAQYNLRHQVASGGTWTEESFVDLRGLFPNLTAGGSTAAGTEFVDNVFRIIDEGDNLKEIAFQASGITTATTRTITMADRDVNLTNVAESFATNGSSVTPSAGILTIVGAAGISTSGVGSTVTITGAGGGGLLPWVFVFLSPQAMSVNTGYIAANDSSLFFTLPSTAATGSIIRVVGTATTTWVIQQNVGQTITWDESSSTTTGVGGSLTATDFFDSIELLCVEDDAEWVVLTSKGNITIV